MLQDLAWKEFQNWKSFQLLAVYSGGKNTDPWPVRRSHRSLRGVLMALGATDNALGDTAALLRPGPAMLQPAQLALRPPPGAATLTIINDQTRGHGEGNGCSTATANATSI